MDQLWFVSHLLTNSNIHALNKTSKIHIIHSCVFHKRRLLPEKSAITDEIS